MGGAGGVRGHNRLKDESTSKREQVVPVKPVRHLHFPASHWPRNSQSEELEQEKDAVQQPAATKPPISKRNATR
jgi:hypothetical protein